MENAIYDNLKSNKSEKKTHQYINTPSTMKKYYQLLLVIVSIVSVGTLLIYRHEYYRLRYVLEVLDFFGLPNAKRHAECTTTNSSWQVRKGLKLNEPLPTWQRLTDSHFIYSAFWETNNKVKHVKAISIDTGKELPKFGCEIWFEQSTSPVSGRFSYNQFINKENMLNVQLGSVDINAYYLYCKPKQNNRDPYGVSFFKTDVSVPSKIFVPVKRLESNLINNSSLACIAPNDDGLTQSSVVEFISFHQLIGINYFIVYQSNFPNYMSEVLKSEDMQTMFGFSMTFLPWNFPLSGVRYRNVIMSVIEKDCIMRTSGSMQNAGLLSWNEYLVPRYHYKLASMLNDFDSSKKTAKFDIPVMTFCTNTKDYDESDHSLPTVLQKRKYFKVDMPGKSVNIYRPEVFTQNKAGSLSTQRVSQGIAAVHSYVDCSGDINLNEPKNYMTDQSVSKFSSDLRQSKLLKFHNYKNLFK